ncbi:hypothetical protein HR12_28430, partial [Microbacterium sp. SUBG005]
MKKRESVGHQLVRLWDDPRARRRRHKAAKKAARAARKRARRTLHDLPLLIRTATPSEQRR